MKLSAYMLPILAVLCETLPAQSQAHETEVCLQQVAQASERLQDCRVRQEDASQCDPAASTLAHYQQRCRNQYFTAEAVARATRYGQEQVKGTPEQSPYRRQLDRARWAETRMRPNLERYLRLFPQDEAFQPALTEHFGTPECPDSYRGQAGRWLYRGAVTLVRYSLSDTAGQTSTPQQKHFFEPEVAGQCYAIPAEPAEQDPLVVNVPQALVQVVQDRRELVRCESPGCSADKQQLAAQYQQYEAAFRQYRILMQCADIEARNQKRGSVKGSSRSVQVLPDYCPQTEVDVAYLNGKGLLEQLDQSLFEANTMPPRQAKSVQD